MDSQMDISVGNDTVNFKTIRVQSLEELAKVALRGNYSLSTYKNNYRNIDNFVQAETIGLDIDDGMSLLEAQAKFKEYAHAIVTTKSHQIEKNGVVCDRFRVILQLERKVTDAKEFYATWSGLQKKFPAIDSACKDPSRFFFKGTKVVSVQETGKKVPVLQYVPTPKRGNKTSIKGDRHGGLSRATMDFFLHGVESNRNMALFKASKDCQEQGYTEEEVIEKLQKAIDSHGNWGTDYVNGKDKEAIKNAFKNQAKYDKRDPKTYEGQFQLKTVEDIFSNKKEIDWVVEGLLTKGGFSIITGQPKAGKSTIARQLALNLSRGERFLDRTTKEINVVYLALEEQEEVLKHQFRKMGFNSKDNVRFHVGPIFTENLMVELEHLILAEKIEFLVLDTLFLFLDVADINSYSEMNKQLSRLRKVARDTGCHIMAVHHQNKGIGGGTRTILGSNAIHGAVDNAIMIQKDGKKRYIFTSQRSGNFYDYVELLFDPFTETYKLGLPREDF